MTPLEFSWTPEPADLSDSLLAHRRFAGPGRRLAFPVGFAVLVVLVAALLASVGYVAQGPGPGGCPRRFRSAAQPTRPTSTGCVT